MEIKIRNHNKFFPNVLHFHGENINQLPKTFKYVQDHDINTDYDKERLTIVSTWTDDDKCCLYQQCKKYDIPLVNCVPENYDRTQKWYMPNKIRFFIDTLKKTDTELVMFLDGYDVLLTHLDDLIKKYESIGYDIVFGPSCNNYPDVKIDVIPNRYKLGHYRFFNAGCCIGKRDALLKFYTESLQYINVNNPLDSEQLIMRHAFARYSYSTSQRFITIDYASYIFQSMGIINSDINYDEHEITIMPNRLQNLKVIVTGCDTLFSKGLANWLRSLTNINVELYETSRKSGQKNDYLKFLIEFTNPDIVYHLEQYEESEHKEELDDFMVLVNACRKTGTRLVITEGVNRTSGQTYIEKFMREYIKTYMTNGEIVPCEYKNITL